MPTLSAAFHRRVPLRRLSDVPADSYFGRPRDICLALGFLFSLNEVEFCLFIGCLQPLPLPFFLSPFQESYPFQDIGWVWEF